MKVHATYTVEVLMDLKKNDDIHEKVCDNCFSTEIGEAVFFNIDRVNIVKAFPKGDAGEYFLDDYDGPEMKVIKRVI